MTDNNNKDDSPSKSKFASHLAILQLEDEDKINLDVLNKEKTLVNQMEVQPLDFLEEKQEASFINWLRRPQWTIISGALAAVFLSFIFINYNQPDPNATGWRMKGNTQIQVYFERNGKISQMQSEDTLQNGDKFRIQVTPSIDAIAFYGLANAAGTLLVPEQFVWDGRISLKAAKKEFFSGSLELEGKNEREKAIVVTCPKTLVSKMAEAVLRPAILQYIKTSVKNAAIDECHMNTTTLR